MNISPFKHSNAEIIQINAAIVALHKAKSALSERQLIELTQEAYKLTRQVIRGRLD